MISMIFIIIIIHISLSKDLTDCFIERRSGGTDGVSGL